MFSVNMTFLSYKCIVFNLDSCSNCLHYLSCNWTLLIFIYLEANKKRWIYIGVHQF